MLLEERKFVYLKERIHKRKAKTAWQNVTVGESSFTKYALVTESKVSMMDRGKNGRSFFF